MSIAAACATCQSTIPVGGRHIHEPSKQMHNRGNGKGGGIAAGGLVPEEMGVSRLVSVKLNESAEKRKPALPAAEAAVA